MDVASVVLPCALWPRTQARIFGMRAVVRNNTNTNNALLGYTAVRSGGHLAPNSLAPVGGMFFGCAPVEQALSYKRIPSVGSVTVGFVVIRLSKRVTGLGSARSLT